MSATPPVTTTERPSLSRWRGGGKAVLQPLGLTEGKRRRLLVVGNGMVGQRFCREIARLKLTDEFDVTVISEENVPAYDRVNLAQIVRGKPVDSLTLSPIDWYAAAGISLTLGAPVLRCSLAARTVSTAAGDIPFDVLVFATGSRPIVPSVEGISRAGVHVYRNARDAQDLREQALRHRDGDLPALIIGAGLLGLEAAAVLSELGMGVELVESSSHLLPRQLDASCAERVERAVVRAGHQLHKRTRVVGISGDAGGLSVELEGGASRQVAFVVVAAGVRPCDEVAKAAGLACDLFGGIEVDDGLSCSAADVYAIGECARHRGLAFGLVAPGYQMAEVLAQRLAGHNARFEGATTSTHLKSRDVEVSAIGESNVSDLATQNFEYEVGPDYRKLVVHRGRLVGAAVIGDWKDLPLVQQAIAERRRMSSRHLTRFETGRPLFGSATLNLARWPADAPVCSCTGTTCGALRKAHARGARTADALTLETGAGSVCGGCRPLLLSLCGADQALQTSTSTLFQIATAFAVVVGLGAAVGPAVPYLESVQHAIAWDDLWRQAWLKQLTGFSLVTVTLVGLAVSARRRWGWFQRFDHRALRTFHVVNGALLLFVLALHTGFRMGANLDLVLSIAFSASILVGAGSALAAIFEQRLGSGLGAKLRRRVTQIHVWVVWPLPVLTAAHVAKVYFF
jgi:nitrite reductase (NADH) large subunit